MRGNMRKLIPESAGRGKPLILRLFALFALFTAIFFSGCVSGISSSMAVLVGPDASLADDLKQEGSPRLARLQSSDNDGKAKKEIPSGPPLPPGPGDLAGPPMGSGLGLPQVANGYRVNVAAWVNGKPLFVEEILFQMSPQVMKEIAKYSPADQAEKKREIVAKQLEHVIDQELMYQDAVHKLEQGNPKTLEKIRKMARDEFNKQMARVKENLKDAKIEKEQMRELTKLLQRKTDREFIATEYMKSRIYPNILRQIGPNEVRNYYQKHQIDFQKQESVKWQDVFIALKPEHPTIADTKQFAESLIAQYRSDGDLKRLLAHNDADNKDRDSEGLGSRRGAIQPIEVEEHLFKLRDGEVGPIVEFSEGVHIIRLVKHDMGGPIPFNETVQKQIQNKLRGEVAELEYKHLVRELRARAVIDEHPEP